MKKPEWLASRLKTGRSYVISSGRAQLPWSTRASPTCGPQETEPSRLQASRCDGRGWHPGQIKDAGAVYFWSCISENS